MRCVVDGITARCDLVFEAWSSRPEQCHRARNVRSSHGRAAENPVSRIRGIKGGARARSRSSYIWLYPAASIDCSRAAATKGGNGIGAGV